MHTNFLSISAQKLYLLVAFASFLGGWRWQSPTRYSSRVDVGQEQARLNYVILKIGATRRLVRAGEVIDIVRGDTLEAEDAVLQDEGMKAEYVNVVGFRNPPDNGMDRGYRVNTNASLLTGFSFKGQGERYAISVGTGKKIHGEVFFRLLPPVLRFATLKVNGEESLVLRDGEPLRIGIDDRLEITKISANFNVNEGLEFNIYRTPSKKAADNAAVHEIRFTRHEEIFARIPLKITEN